MSMEKGGFIPTTEESSENNAESLTVLGLDSAATTEFIRGLEKVGNFPEIKLFMTEVPPRVIRKDGSWVLNPDYESIGRALSEKIMKILEAGNFDRQLVAVACNTTLVPPFAEAMIGELEEQFPEGRRPVLVDSENYDTVLNDPPDLAVLSNLAAMEITFGREGMPLLVGTVPYMRTLGQEGYPVLEDCSLVEESQELIWRIKAISGDVFTLDAANRYAEILNTDDCLQIAINFFRSLQQRYGDAPLALSCTELPVAVKMIKAAGREDVLEGLNLIDPAEIVGRVAEEINTHWAKKEAESRE